MKKYEYKTFLLPKESSRGMHNYTEYETSYLNALGKQGWEVVANLSSSYDGIMLLLKREISNLSDI